MPYTAGRQVCIGGGPTWHRSTPVVVSILDRINQTEKM